MFASGSNPDGKKMVIITPVFWNVTSRTSADGYQHSGAACCLRLQGIRQPYMETAGAYCPQTRRWSLLEMRCACADFARNDELLLPTLKAFAHCICSLAATRNAWCFQTVCCSTPVCRPNQLHTTASSTQHRATHHHPPFLRDHLVACCLYLPNCMASLRRRQLSDTTNLCH